MQDSKQLAAVTAGVEAFLRANMAVRLALAGRTARQGYVAARTAELVREPGFEPGRVAPQDRESWVALLRRSSEGELADWPNDISQSGRCLPKRRGYYLGYQIADNHWRSKKSSACAFGVPVAAARPTAATSPVRSAAT